MKHGTPDLLLFAPKPAHNGTGTSRIAANSAEAKAPSNRARILAHLLKCFAGRTIDELARELEICPDTVKARVHELGQTGLVAALAEYGTSFRGAQAMVFIARDKAGGRELQAWPLPRIDWKAKHDAMERRAIDAERRVEELEERLARMNQPQESVA